MYQAQLQISEQDIRTVQPQVQPSGATFTPSIKFGQFGGAYDAKTYVFGLNNGTTAAVGGQLQTAPAAVTNHLNRTQTVAQAALATIGSTTMQVTVGATAVTQNQYLQGLMVVVSGTGAGQQSRMRSNTAAVSSGTTTLTLTDPLVVALDNTSVVSLYPSYWNGFSVTSTTLANNNPVGVTSVAVPVNNYAWLLVSGETTCLTDSTTLTKNIEVIPGASAGSVGINTTSVVTQVLGYAPEALTSSAYQPVVFNMPF